MSILFAIILQTVTQASIPNAPLQVRIFDNSCHEVRILDIESFDVMSSKIYFQTLSHHIVVYDKNKIKEIHASVGKEDQMLFRYPSFDLENISNSQCKENSIS